MSHSPLNPNRVKKSSGQLPQVKADEEWKFIAEQVIYLMNENETFFVGEHGALLARQYNSPEDIIGADEVAIQYLKLVRLVIKQSKKKDQNDQS